MKTKEEILSKYNFVFYEEYPNSTGVSVEKYDCLEAMQEYSDQNTLELKSKLQESLNLLQEVFNVCGHVKLNMVDRNSVVPIMNKVNSFLIKTIN